MQSNIHSLVLDALLSFSCSMVCPTPRCVAGSQIPVSWYRVIQMQVLYTSPVNPWRATMLWAFPSFMTVPNTISGPLQQEYPKMDPSMSTSPVRSTMSLWSVPKCCFCSSICRRELLYTTVNLAGTEGLHIDSGI